MEGDFGCGLSQILGIVDMSKICTKATTGHQAGQPSCPPSMPRLEVDRNPVDPPDETIVNIQGLLNRLQDDDGAAIGELLRYAYVRLRKLVSKNFGSDRLRELEETDDVLQIMMVRLSKALKSCRPETPSQFFGLARVYYRRVVHSLARHYWGPHGQGAIYANKPRGDDSRAGGIDPVDPGPGPDILAQKAELRRLVDELPPKERDVIELWMWNDLNLVEISKVLEIDPKIVRRRKTRALERLSKILQPPETQDEG